MTSTDAHIDAVRCRELLARWDAQQEVYVAHRELGVRVMLAVLDDLFPAEVTVLDLAAGPGFLSSRLVDHRPDAHCVALDADPVLQAVGHGALGDMGGRLRWVKADLRDADWADTVSGTRFDAVLSSTALHWLQPAPLTALYEQLGSLLGPGGVFMNFDGFRSPATTPLVGQIVKRLDHARQRTAIAGGAEAWQDWWDAARAVPELAERFAERDRVFPPASGRVFAGSERRGNTTAALHVAALEAAGFAEVGCVWQDLHKQVLLAVR